MRFRHVAVVRVPSETAYGWWTSFSDEDGDEGGPLVSRRVLGQEGDRIVIEDEYLYLGRRLRLRGRVKLNPPDSYVVELDGHTVNIRLHYMFSPVVEGTQLVVIGDLRGKGFLRLALPLMWPRIRREIVAGIDGNARRVEALHES
jgi:signal peptidase I